MKNKILCLALVAIILALPAIHATAAPDFYTTYTALLQRHVHQGEVNYTTLQKDRTLLRQLVNQVAGYNLKEASVAEKKAFYLNAYNLLVLDQVLAHYPLKSVMDVEGFFDRTQYKVAGEQLTLNELEKQKLLQPYKDARVHFALVCAAKSCPPLRSQAFMPQSVEQQLQDQAKRALNNPEFVKIQVNGKQVQISEIFKWYKDDFLNEAESITAYINKFRSTPLPAKYSLSYYTYNWQLNNAD
ncbi:DUF547 domain-containing protein [Pontibacter oryzae]|uniref:DUF547 domain-containing protein n=1 Tax=Pontibacter oryzae TaxID=2304593 RepID=A0A399RYB7_9BACT|nr:DUF547 domain-containing protein [Pontibacter oryzae]RIJ34395.1 DUF547 domain-containing protein [Pontibacter oryzae]